VLLWQPYQAAPGSGATPSPSPSGTATPKGAATPTATGTATPRAAPGPDATQQAKTSALIVRDGATPSPQSSGPKTPAADVPATPGAATPKAGSPSPSAAASTGASSSTAYGDPSQVNAATKKLFNKLVCKPGPNSTTTDESWKATVGYNNQLSQWDDPKSQTVSCDPTGAKFVLGPTVVEGTDVTSASPQLQQNSTAWIVSITLDSKATKAFGDLTTSQASKYLPGASSNQDDAVLDQIAVVLGGDVVVAPETQGALTGGSFQVNGGSTGFTQAEATNLANVVKYGQLPLNFERLSANYVSPTLGHNSLVAGLIAGLIGLVVVLAYLLFYYRGLGLFIAVPSLLLSALLSYLGVVLLSAHASFTMTLAAIAGLIVAIGITADSFIVYFERLRDEVREGKQLRPAVEGGWRRARRTILVSDTVQFLAAVLLYKFATSDVQGFAFTLGLTTIIDVIVVFTFTKPMMTLLAGQRFFSSGHRWSGLDPKRLGARTPWRSGVRRQQRTTQGPRTTRTASTTREA
jgi:preprotein translocase subunit SecD